MEISGKSPSVCMLERVLDWRGSDLIAHLRKQRPNMSLFLTDMVETYLKRQASTNRTTPWRYISFKIIVIDRIKTLRI